MINDWNGMGLTGRHDSHMHITIKSKVCLHEYIILEHPSLDEISGVP